MVGGHIQKGMFINNICDNTDIPEPCLNVPRSLFYFTYKRVDGGTECVSLIGIGESEQLRAPDHDEPEKSFIILDKAQQNKFRAKVVCDPRFNYPQFTTSIDELGFAQFEIASKFSCGETNHTARSLDNQKVWICVMLIVFGLFILMVAGTSFNKFMVVVAGIILFVVLIFFIFTWFGFQLGGYTSSVIIGAAVTISVFIKFIVKKIKEVFNALTTILTVKIGYTYGAILFPNSPLHERVD